MQTRPEGLYVAIFLSSFCAEVYSLEDTTHLYINNPIFDSLLRAGSRYVS